MNNKAVLALIEALRERTWLSPVSADEMNRRDRWLADELESLLAAPLEPSGWQPIEMAPQVADWGCSPVDVLLYGRGLGVRTGRAVRYPDGSAFAGVSNISGNIAHSLATHWQHLPASPSASTEQP